MDAQEMKRQAGILKQGNEALEMGDEARVTEMKDATEKNRGCNREDEEGGRHVKAGERSIEIGGRSTVIGMKDARENVGAVDEEITGL